MTDTLDSAIGLAFLSFFLCLALDVHGKAGPPPGAGGGDRGDLPNRYKREWTVGKAGAVVSGALFVVALVARCVAGSP